MTPSFPAGEFEARAERVLRESRAAELDALLLVGVFPEKDGHVCYLTNHRNWLPQWPMGRGFSGVGFSFCILTPAGNAHLAAAAVDQDSLAPIVGRVTRTLDAYRPVVEELTTLFAGRDGRLGVAGLDIMPAALYRLILAQLPGLHIVDAEPILWRARLIKTQAERALLAEMGAVADAAIMAAIRETAPGVSNAEISAQCVAGALAAGADHVLRCRLRSGPETTGVRWPFASGRRVDRGEFVQVDLVGVFRKYVFDVSRVWTVGPPTPEQVRLIELASAITKFMAIELRPGKQIGRVADEMIARFSGQLPGVQVICEGHSCGLDVVEFPWVDTGVDEVVHEGMFLNLEPHIKVTGKYTLKIEDQIIVGREANQVINLISHLPPILEASK